MPRKKLGSVRPSGYFGDRSVPILVATRALQELLAVLARHGSLRLADAADALGVIDLHISKAIIDSGIVLRFGRDRVQYLALNESLPAFAELRNLLLALEPQKAWRPRLSVENLGPPTEIGAQWASALYGHTSRFDALLAIEALGGMGTRQQIAALMGVHGSRVHVIMRSFRSRGITVSNGGSPQSWSFANAAWQSALRNYLSEVLSGRPVLREMAMGLARPQEPTTAGTRRRSRYKNVVIRTAQRPVGWEIPSNGAPLIFSSDARRRILEVVALKGVATYAEIRSLAQASSDGTLRALLACGLLVRGRLNSKTVYRIADDVPGREHLGALLEVTARAYSPALAELSLQPMEPATGRWLGDIETLFGFQSRGVALIGARSTNGVDASTLHRLAPGVERVQCRRALHLFERLGVLRTRREGNAILYELNANWIGYDPICAFIDALIAASPRHQAWKKVVPLVQSRRRRKMAENARRRANGSSSY